MKIKLIDYGYCCRPNRMYFDDAGADVYAREQYTVWPNTTLKIPLGFGVEIPNGFMGLVLPRSGLAAQGITCASTPIDSGYRGEIHAVVTNTGQERYIINAGDRIGQLVILPCAIPDFVVSYGDTRGDRGFASTGK